MADDIALAQIEADLLFVLGDGFAKSEVQFDSSQASIDILKAVLRWAKGRLQLNRAILDNIGPYIANQNDKVSKLDECLERLGLCHADVDQSQILTDLSLASQLLSVRDCKIYSYISALSDLQSRLIDVDELIESDEFFEANILKQFSNEIAPIFSALERFSGEVEKSSPSNSDLLRALNAEKGFYIKTKQEEYRQSIQQSETGLEQNGYDPRLSHENLCELKTTLDELKVQIQPYKDRLQSYQELPPNLDLARMAVERAKRELQDIQIEWQGRLSGIESVFNI